MNDVIGEVRSRLSVSRPLPEPNAGMSPAAKKLALILLIPIVCVGAALAFGDQQAAIALVGLFAMLGIVVSLVGLFSRRLRGMFGKIAVCSFLLFVGAIVMSPNKGQPAPSSATSTVRAVAVAAPRKGPHGLPIVSTISSALVCLTSERLLSASLEISRGSQMWQRDYPDCAILPQGTELEYDFREAGFSSGLNGYSGVVLTAPDHSTSSKGFLFKKALDRQPRAGE